MDVDTGRPTSATSSPGKSGSRLSEKGSLEGPCRVWKEWDWRKRRGWSHPLCLGSGGELRSWLHLQSSAIFTSDQPKLPPPYFCGLPDWPQWWPKWASGLIPGNHSLGMDPALLACCLFRAQKLPFFLFYIDSTRPSLHPDPSVQDGSKSILATLSLTCTPIPSIPKLTFIFYYKYT